MPNSNGLAQFFHFPKKGKSIIGRIPFPPFFFRKGGKLWERSSFLIFFSLRLSPTFGIVYWVTNWTRAIHLGLRRGEKTQTFPDLFFLFHFPHRSSVRRESHSLVQCRETKYAFKNIFAAFPPFCSVFPNSQRLKIIWMPVFLSNLKADFPYTVSFLGEKPKDFPSYIPGSPASSISSPTRMRNAD